MSSRAATDQEISVVRKIEGVRIKKDISVVDVANGIGITRQQYKKYASGANRMSLGRFLDISKYLGVHPSTLLS